MPATVSSTTAASSADSCWMPITVGCRCVENRLASTLTNGSDAEREQREQRVDAHEDHGDRDDRDQVRDRERDQHDDALDLLQVGVGPAHQLAGLRPVVEGEVQALEVGEQPVAQLGLGPAGLPERASTAGGR